MNWKIRMPTQVNHVDVLTGIGELIERLNTRAVIRRSIKERKSVKEGKPDRISDLLEEAADKLEAIADELIETQTKLAVANSK